MSLFPIIGGFSTALITGGYESAANADHNSASKTFTAQAIGTAATDRRVVVCVHGTADTRTISSMTIGGESAVNRAVVQNSTGTSEIWDAIVDAGTTGDIVVNWSGTQRVTGISVYAIYGSSATIHDTATSVANPLDLDVNVAAGGFVIATNTDLVSNTTTWVGLTEDLDVEVALGRHQSTASDAFTSSETARNITSTPSGTPTNYCGVSASYQPG